jgi:hypothetical protein
MLELTKWSGLRLGEGMGENSRTAIARQGLARSVLWVTVSVGCGPREEVR